MTEAIAKAVNSKNLQQKETHCTVDVVHSMGIAGIEYPIGIAALRFIHGLDAKAYTELLYGLQRKAGRKMKCDKSVLLKVCKQVIKEAADVKCHFCKGIAHGIVNSKIIQCPECNGSGLHRHTDMQRAQAIGIAFDIYIRHWADRLFEVQSIFTNECRNATRITKGRLHD
jgi:hypothetical protein